MRSIGFIGAGNMAETIINGLTDGHNEKSFDIRFYNRSEARRNDLARAYRIVPTRDNIDLYEACDVVVVAVKPQQFPSVVEELQKAGALSRRPLVISIMAGVTLESLEKAFHHDRVVRVMPNVAAQVKESMSLIACGSGADSGDKDFASFVFSAVGEALIVNEDVLDAASAMNGCGPAFFFQIIEACADALVALGIGRDMAYRITAQTMAGSAALVLKEDHPGVLKDKVTSPGGTTIAGIIAMEKSGVRYGMISAIKAAYDKNKSLTKNN